MADRRQFIGFDIGAESGRCVVGILERSPAELTMHEVRRFATPSVDSGEHLHWDVLQLHSEILRSLREVSGEFSPSFDGISIDTWGVDYVLLDADDRLLGYPYHYRDKRTDGMIDHAARIMPKRQIYEHSGIQFLQLNTLFQLLAEQQQSLNLISVASAFLPMPNYLGYLLTGRKFAEYTIASTTQLCDARTRQWSPSILEAFGLPEDIFPEITEPESVPGTLTATVAEKTGMSEQTPVIAGASHDTAAAVASVPADGADWAFLSSGTWSLMGIELDEPVITDQSLAHNFTNEGGVAGTTRFLKNIMGLWPLQECRRSWQQAGQHYDYDDLENLARETQPVKAWIDVDEPRFLKPGRMVEKVIAYLKETGQTYREEPGWITRCILESLGFKYRMVIEELEEITGSRIQTLHTIGGGIRNTLLCQLTADATEKRVIAGPVEGTAAGNIGIQALTVGLLPDLSSLRAMIRRSVDMETYTPEQPDYWQENLSRYRSMIMT